MHQKRRSLTSTTVVQYLNRPKYHNMHRQMNLSRCMNVELFYCTPHAHIVQIVQYSLGLRGQLHEASCFA